MSFSTRTKEEKKLNNGHSPTCVVRGDADRERPLRVQLTQRDRLDLDLGPGDLGLDLGLGDLGLGGLGLDLGLPGDESRRRQLLAASRSP